LLKNLLRTSWPIFAAPPVTKRKSFTILATGGARNRTQPKEPLRLDFILNFKTKKTKTFSSLQINRGKRIILGKCAY
jgi:hypothetical protein